MILIVGLGNPGSKYAKTRHNIGFCVLDKFRKENDSPCFKLSEKFDSLISEGKIGRRKILLAKPQTFMNNSGKAVKSLSAYYKLLSKNLIVVHDDIDLPLGKIKIVKNRGSAGHKGAESIIKELKTQKFIRVRIGIQKSKVSFLTSDVKKLKDFVLEKFTKDEEKIVKRTVKKTSRALRMVITAGLEQAMNEYNK